MKKLSVLHQAIIKNCPSAEDRAEIHKLFIDRVTAADGLTDAQKKESIKRANNEYDKANIYFKNTAQSEIATPQTPQAAAQARAADKKIESINTSQEINAQALNATGEKLQHEIPSEVVQTLKHGASLSKENEETRGTSPSQVTRGPSPSQEGPSR